MNPRKFANKLGGLAGNNVHLAARVRHKLDFWRDRGTSQSKLADSANSETPERCVARLLGVSPDAAVEQESRIVGDHIAALRREEVGQEQRIEPSADGTQTLGRLCFAVCCYLRPKVVIETGVAHGVTSTYILWALERNNLGTLHSIDLPPLGADVQKDVGLYVPANLRNRWQLHIGPASVELARVFRTVSEPDVFVHDSLHTYRHMSWEFDLALRQLRTGGVVIADDVQGNRAFEEAILRPDAASWVVLREEGKNALCGALTKRMASEHII
jgi:Methyltransferase domain